MRTVALGALVSVLALSACRTPQGDEVVFSLYGGGTEPEPADLHVRSGNSDLEIEKVDFRTEDLEPPPFYGLRLSYWFEPRWAIALDFTHPKVIADTDQVRNVTGAFNGMPVSGSQPISGVLERFKLSHGHNFLTLNAMHRWFPSGARDESFLGRLQPYVGAGAGVALPHVEVTFDGTETEEYQIAGPVVQGFAGVSFDVWKWFAVFGEYKLSYQDLSLDLAQGGTIELETLTHQFIFGLSFALLRPAA